MTGPNSDPPPADPNLIVIGAQKCGTTSLHRYLAAHPEITMHRLKETDFFLRDDPSDAEVEAYRRSFVPPAPVRGEASPNYTNLPKSAGTAERIAAMLPEARLVYLVRDPIERLASQYVHYRAAGVERRSAAEAIRDPGASYVNRSRFAHQLRPFIASFPGSRIHVIAAEDLLVEREATMQSLFRFLGVRADVSSPEFDRLWEQSTGKGRLYRMLWPLAAAARRRGWTTPRFIKWPLQRLIRGRGEAEGQPAASEVRSVLSPEDLDFLTAELAADAAEFAALGTACEAATRRWRTWAELSSASRIGQA